MNDQLTTRLREQLHDQVDDLHGAPLTFESVRGRAHAIRRTRRIAVAGAAAVAVAAIAVPTALLGDSAGRSDAPPVVDTPTDTVAPTPRADGTFRLTIDAAEGPVPDTGYLDVREQQYVTPDRTYDLPGVFTQIAQYDDGWVGIRFARQSPTGFEVVVLDSDVEEVSASPSGQRLATNDDGSRVAWLDVTGGGSTGTLVNAPVDGTVPSYTPVSSQSEVEGFLDDDLVAVSRFDGRTGETSFMQVPAGTLGDVSEATSLAGYQRVDGVSPSAGLAAGQTKYRRASTCSEVRRTDGEEVAVVVETCDHQLGAFSPDGQLLIGFASYFDYGSPMLAILDAATGEPVVEWTDDGTRRQDAAYVMSAAWDDEDTVVAVVEQGGEQQVLRFEADGSVTRSGEPRRAQMSTEYHLPADLN